MSEMNQIQVQLGDWVSGTTVEDERIRGYIEKISRKQSSALVRVTESDHEDIVGRVAESLLSKLELLKVEAVMDEKALYDLIDIALATRDKQWFTELTSTLEALRTSKGKKKQRSLTAYTPITHRRIWME
jgi:hypothetical protein